MARLLLFAELVSLKWNLELLPEFKLGVTEVFLVASSLLTSSTTWLLKKTVKFQVTMLLKARKQMMHLTTWHTLFSISTCLRSEKD